LNKIIEPKNQHHYEYHTEYTKQDIRNKRR